MKKINQKKATKNHSPERLALKKDGMDYFFEKMKLLDRRKAEDEKSALLKGACDIFGNKTKEMMSAYLSYINNPCFETWKNFRSFLVLPNNTAWQIWCLSDSAAPMENEVEKFPDPAEFEQYYKDISKKEYLQYENYYLDQAFAYYSELYNGCMIEEVNNAFVLTEDSILRKKTKYQSYKEAFDFAEEKIKEGHYIFLISKVDKIIIKELP